MEYDKMTPQGFEVGMRDLLPKDDNNIFEDNQGLFPEEQEINIPPHSNEWVGNQYTAEQELLTQHANKYEGYSPVGEYDFRGYAPKEFRGVFGGDKGFESAMIYSPTDVAGTSYGQGGSYFVAHPKTGELMNLDELTHGSYAMGQGQWGKEDKYPINYAREFQKERDILESQRHVSRGGGVDESGRFMGDVSHLTDDYLKSSLPGHMTPGYGSGKPLYDWGDEANFKTNVESYLANEGLDQYGDFRGQYIGEAEHANLLEHVKRQGYNITDANTLERADFGTAFKEARGGRSTLGMSQKDVPTFTWQGKEYHTRTADEENIIKGMLDEDKSPF